MAEEVHSDIIINVDTSVGIAEIKNLQKAISSLNAQLMQSGAAQAKAAQNVQRNLINNINATGQFAARIKTISSTAETFTTRLEKNKLGMGEYFRYAGAASKTFGKLFKNEFDTIEKVARERVKTLQTQYIKLGRDANGALKAISVRPLALDMENLATKTAMAAQKQQLMNQLLKQGSTNLLNFGKNTQWAGRQLMVGFSIPLAYLGTAAAKTFMKMEEQAIRFKRVYGDTFTATSETDKMVQQVKDLANEFTKYGVAAEKTMAIAADVAAMGKTGSDLIAQLTQANRLAVLGGVEQSQALETTISLTNAFGIAADQLSGKINFLNAVENQTVTSIEDLTIAVPKAGPVIQQLGGDVEDLAFFLTAMKEGGINASEGANALKSGLAALINPTAKASEMLGAMGINIKGIVEANKGDVKATVVGFAQALDTLDPLNRARAIEQLFGKFQFARLSTLFKNVVAEGSQAQRVMQLSNATTEQLAVLSERELKRVEDSPMYKFKKVIEDVKVSLIPLGEAFLKAVTPIGEFVKGFLDKFNSMGDGAKQFAVIATTVIAGIGPVLLMTFGLIANGAANMIKLFLGVRKIFQGVGIGSRDLASQTEYMTQQQIEAAGVAASLDQSHGKLIQTFNVEAGAVDKLAQAYGRAMAAQAGLSGINIGGKAKGKAPRKLASGIISVPGPKGAGDIVPAMLAPGEAVIPADMASKYSGLIGGMIDDTIPGFENGRKSRYDTSTPSGVVQALGKRLRESPNSFKKAAETLGYGSFMQEDQIVKAVLKSKFPELSQSQIANYVGKYDLAHISKTETKQSIGGKEISVKTWQTKNIQKEHRLVNQALENLANKKGFLSSFSAKDIASLTGLPPTIAGKELRKLQSGGHPNNRQGYEVLKAIAGQAMSHPAYKGAAKPYFAVALESLLDYRLKDNSSGSYLKALTSGKLSIDPKLAAKLDESAAKTQMSKIERARINLAKLGPVSASAVKPVKPTMKSMKSVTAKSGKLNLSDLLSFAANRGRRYANGIVSVPGPKGAGDVVPAMLSPGESVIPAGMSKKYSPLISGMIDGSIPGYESGLLPPSSDDWLGAGATNDYSEKSGRSMARGFLSNTKAIGKSLAGTVATNIGPVSKKLATGFVNRLENSPMLARAASKLTGGANEVVTKSGRAFSGGAEVIPGQITQTGNRYYKINDAGKKVPVSKEFAQAQQRQQAQQASSARFSKASGLAGAVGGVASMAGMGMMMSGDQSGVGNGLMMGGMALSVLPMLLPLLTNPVGGVVAGLAAFAGAMIYFKMQADEATKSGLDMGKALSMTNKKLEDFATINGTVTASQEARKKNELQLTGENAKKRYYGQNFLESEAGKGLLSNAETMTKAGKSSKEVATNFAQQLSYAVVQGAITQEQAMSIAAALGEKLQDYSITANIDGQLVRLLGKNGENLLEDPLKITLEIQRQSTEAQVQTFENALSTASENSANDWISNVGGALTGISTGLFVASGAAAVTGIGAVAAPFLAAAGALTGLAGGGMLVGGQIANEGDKQENNKARGVAVQLGAEQIAQNQGLVDSLQKQYDIQIQQLEQKKKAAKTDEQRKDIEGQITDKINARNTAVEKQKKANADVLDNLVKQAGIMGSGFNEAIGMSIDERFKNTTGAVKAAADLAKGQLSGLADQKGGKQNVFKTTLQIGLASGEFDPITVSNLAAMAAKDGKIETSFGILVDAQGTSEANQIVQLLAKSGTDSKEYSVILDYLNKNPDTFKEDQEALAQIANMQQEYGIKVKVTATGIKAVRTFTNEIKDLDNGKPVTKEILTKFLESHPGMSADSKSTIQEMINNWDVLSGGDNKLKYSVLVDYKIGQADDMAVLSAYEGHVSMSLPATTENITKARAWFFSDGADGPSPDPVVDSGPVGDGGTKKNPLDDILNKLKMVRDASIKAAGGIGELRRVLGKTGGKNITTFTGVEQNLFKKDNVSSEFMDFYNNLDAKAKATYVSISGSGSKAVAKLTADGKAVQAALREIAIGDYQSALVKQKQDAMNSAKAFQVLKDAGMSAADALDVSKDASLADAIANKTNKQEVLNLVKAFNELADAQTAADKFQKTFDEARAAWDAKKNKLEIDFKVNTKDFQKTVTDAENDIAKKINQAGGLDDLQAGLTQIGWAEDEINKKYDLRLEALDRVASANERILAAQRGQLTIADALSRGDISAAAAAIQDQRARDSQDAIASQRDLLDNARKAELGAVTADVNGVKMTRKEIEAKILVIEKEILDIEEKRLEPARESIRLEEVKRVAAIASLEEQELEWQKLENDIALAATAAWDYVSALEAAKAAAAQAVVNASSSVGQSVTNALQTGGSYAVPTGGVIAGGNYFSYMNQPGYRASGGIIPKYFSNGDLAKGTDVVPAMLTPGEFIMSKYAVDSFGVDNMKAINSGTFQGSTVYNSYDLNVNVRSDANPNEIARVVMTQIKQVDSQRARGIRL